MIDPQKFQREVEDCNAQQHTHKPGAVVVADPNNSQFYFVLTRKTTKHLDGKYLIFAQVVKGMDKINKIEEGDRINRVSVLPGMTSVHSSINRPLCGCAALKSSAARY